MTYSEADLARLVERLERCELSNSEFHHEQHLAVTAYYVRNVGEDQALNRVREAIQRLAAYHGVSQKYNETITRFWVEQVAKVMEECGEMSLSEAVAVVVERLGDKELVFRHKPAQACR